MVNVTPGDGGGYWDDYAFGSGFSLIAAAHASGIGFCYIRTGAATGATESTTGLPPGGGGGQRIRELERGDRDMAAETAKVFIVDDDAAVQQSIRWLVESVDRATDVFGSGDAFLDSYAPSQPGCVLTDVRMPGTGGLQLIENLRQRGCAIPVIVMTAHGDVATAVKAMKAGALDFLEKPVDDQHLLELIETAVTLDREHRRAQQALDITLAKFETLTKRESVVMSLVAEGNSNKEIARMLEVSPKTVEAHRAKVMEKMAAGSLADLVKLSAVCF